MEETWAEYAKLLKEAVIHEHYHGVKKLLEYESVIESVDNFKEKNKIPLCLAIEQRNIPIINLFRKHNYDLSNPHRIDCSCEACIEDEFGQTKYKVILLKALSSPVWISLTAEDPFLTTFKLCWKVHLLKNCSDSFQEDYEKICTKNEKFCCDLLDEIRTQEEGATLMRCKTISQKSECRDLQFIDLAIEYQQKEVVAHSVTQHFLTSTVFGEIPKWKTSGVVYKLLVIVALGLMYPFTTILNILVPSSCGTCSGISQFAMKPFVKFVNGAFSFITFLLLLTILGAIDRNGIRMSREPSGIEIAVFVWLLGFCFAECKQLYKNGIKGYFSSGWNWVDVGMDLLMLFSFIAWAVLYYHTPEKTNLSKFAYETTMYVADFAFTVSIILSFFRVIYLCQITRYLGLLQMCLGEMILVIFQFAFISIVVLLSFTVGMVYLSNSTNHGRNKKIIHQFHHANHTAIYTTFGESFDGFFSTLFTMVYVSLTMEGTETLEDFNDGTLVQLWANLLFIAYFGITMIVVLNMLIAMMNNSYQRIVDNMNTWFLNSRTQLWMEYVGNEHTRPVPFNLIPSIDDIVAVLKRIGKCCCKDAHVEDLEKAEKEKFRNICDNLVKRYLRKTFGCCDFDAPPKEIKNEEDDYFLQKIEHHYERWKNCFISKSSNTSSLPISEEADRHPALLQISEASL